MFGIDLDPRTWVNVGILKEPLNWAIVFIIASISLMLMHTAMVAFGVLQGTKPQVAFAGPGQLNIPHAVGNFAVPGLLGSDPFQGDLGAFVGYGQSSWTDGMESKFAEDGWIGNP